MKVDTLSTLLACLLFAVCASSKYGNRSSLRAFYNEFADVNNNLAVKLFLGARNSNGHKDNVIVSPYSVITGLGMLSVAAHGQTKDEILRVLRAEKMGNKHVAYALRRLTAIPNNTLSVANKVWVQSSMAICNAFQRRMERYYHTSLQQVNFQSDPNLSRDIVNDWVQNTTNGHIRDLLPRNSVTSSTRLVLTNAVYMKAQWADEFNASETKREQFTTCTHKGKGSSQVNMMYKTGEYNYKVMTRPDLRGYIEVLEIPYRAINISMFFVLPDRSTCNAIRQFGNVLTSNVIRDLQANMSKTQIDIRIPKFNLSDDTQIDKIFQGMGIRRAFSETEADLSGIDCDRQSTNPLHLSKSFHQAMVVMNERGTEGGAGSAVTVTNRSFKTFHANRSFLFMIIDKKTEAILFIGQVVNP